MDIQAIYLEQRSLKRYNLCSPAKKAYNERKGSIKFQTEKNENVDNPVDLYHLFVIWK